MSENWNKLFESDDFIKWRYKESPYRVVAFSSNRGHWQVIFTSVYGFEGKLIKGNLGGGTTGKMKAKAISKMFFEKHSYGCAPPSEITDYKI